MLVRKAPWKLAIALAFFALGGRAFAGCGGPLGANVCDLKCSCERCPVEAWNDCLDKVDREADEASRNGCFDRYDHFLACEEARGECRKGKDWHTDCDPEEHQWHDCLEH